MTLPRFPRLLLTIWLASSALAAPPETDEDPFTIDVNLSSPAPPPVVASPFTGEPDRRFDAPASPDQIRAIASVAHRLLKTAHAPAAPRVKTVIVDIQRGMAAGRLCYFDAVQLIISVRNVLDGPDMSERQMHELVKTMRARLIETLLTQREQRDIIYNMRQVMASARKGIP
jgi:hypothetical protein